MKFVKYIAFTSLLLGSMIVAMHNGNALNDYNQFLIAAAKEDRKVLENAIGKVPCCYAFKILADLLLEKYAGTADSNQPVSTKPQSTHKANGGIIILSGYHSNTGKLILVDKTSDTMDKLLAKIHQKIDKKIQTCSNYDEIAQAEKSICYFMPTGRYQDNLPLIQEQFSLAKNAKNKILINLRAVFIKEDVEQEMKYLKATSADIQKLLSRAGHDALLFSFITDGRDSEIYDNSQNKEQLDALVQVLKS